MEILFLFFSILLTPRVKKSPRSDAQRMFPLSKTLPELNEETHGEKWRNIRVEWFLMADESHFHVYVKAVIKKLGLVIRIDWRNVSELQFEKFQPDEKVSECLRVGETDWFCRHCIIECLKSDMRTYRLFQFNCRTVAFIILTKVCLFSSSKVENMLDNKSMLCGLDERECLSEPEIKHYLAYTKRTGEACILF